jgi:hypothetical protein
VAAVSEVTGDSALREAHRAAETAAANARESRERIQPTDLRLLEPEETPAP